MRGKYKVNLEFVFLKIYFKLNPKRVWILQLATSISSEYLSYQYKQIFLSRIKEETLVGSKTGCIYNQYNLVAHFNSNINTPFFLLSTPESKLRRVFSTLHCTIVQYQFGFIRSSHQRRIKFEKENPLESSVYNIQILRHMFSICVPCTRQPLANTQVVLVTLGPTNSSCAANRSMT